MIKKTIITLLFVISTLFLIGCSLHGDPVYDPINRPVYYTKEELNLQRLAEYDVQFLFELDGTKIYRFHDSGHNRYFAVSHRKENSSMINDLTVTNTGKATYTSDQSVQTTYDN